MIAHETRLTALDFVCPDVVVGTVRRPEGYEFAAGQWFRLSIETPEGTQTRTLSHASAPADEDLDFATRLSDSAFKRALAGMSPGDPVAIAGPGGRLALPEGWTRAVMLVGGVGITPVRSLLRDMAARGRSVEEALVIYGNREPSCAPFAAELEELSGHGVRVVDVFETAPDGFDCERGFITAELLRRHGVAPDGRPFLVAGPPPMVAAMERVLDELGVALSDRRIERFGPAA